MVACRSASRNARPASGRGRPVAGSDSSPEARVPRSRCRIRCPPGAPSVGIRLAPTCAGGQCAYLVPPAAPCRCDYPVEPGDPDVKPLCAECGHPHAAHVLDDHGRRTRPAGLGMCTWQSCLCRDWYGPDAKVCPDCGHLVSEHTRIRSALDYTLYYNVCQRCQCTSPSRPDGPQRVPTVEPRCDHTVLAVGPDGWCRCPVCLLSWPGSHPVTPCPACGRCHTAHHCLGASGAAVGRCHECHGDGDEAQRQCPECHGTGVGPSDLALCVCGHVCGNHWEHGDTICCVDCDCAAFHRAAPDMCCTACPHTLVAHDSSGRCWLCGCKGFTV